MHTMSLLQTSGRLMMILSPLGAKNRPTISNHSLKLLMDCRKRVTWSAFVIFFRCWHSIHHVLVASCVMLIVGFFGFLLLGAIGSVYCQLPAVSICLIQFGYQMFPVSPNINVTLGAAKGLIDDLIDKIVGGTPRTEIQAKVMRNHSFLYM